MHTPHYIVKVGTFHLKCGTLAHFPFITYYDYHNSIQDQHHVQNNIHSFILLYTFLKYTKKRENMSWVQILYEIVFFNVMK